MGCRNISKLTEWSKCTFPFSEYEDIFLCKFTHIKHENNTNIRHSLGTYVFMAYLRETVNQKVNILMKTKININLNRKSEIKNYFAFLSITRVLEKVIFHIELRNAIKTSCLL